MKLETLPPLTSATDPLVEAFVGEFLHKERRHWKGFESAKHQLAAELARVTAVLENVEGGHVDPSQVDVEHLENQRTDCEMGLLDLEQ
jgi:hypothetical protein